jgi:hypothetical protein
MRTKYFVWDFKDMYCIAVVALLVEIDAASSDTQLTKQKFGYMYEFLNEHGEVDGEPMIFNRYQGYVY